MTLPIHFDVRTAISVEYEYFVYVHRNLQQPFVHDIQYMMLSSDFSCALLKSWDWLGYEAEIILS